MKPDRIAYLGCVHYPAGKRRKARRVTVPGMGPGAPRARQVLEAAAIKERKE